MDVASLVLSQRVWYTEYMRQYLQAGRLVVILNLSVVAGSMRTSFLFNHVTSMKISGLSNITSAVFIVLYVTVLAGTAQAEEEVTLQADKLEHIQFNKIPANKHSFANGILKIEVDASASFLMLPFEKLKKIKQLSFDWRSEGVPDIKDASQEAARDGDDAVFKVGLLLKTEDDSFNPFLPSWMKQVKALLHYPSENMIDLVVDSKHTVGEQWLNPYNKRVLMISIESVKGEDGWWHSRYQSEQPLDVVAIWLMADGDNTHSKFTSYVKNISFD